MSNVDPRSLARLISEDIRTNNGFLFEAGEKRLHIGDEDSPPGPDEIKGSKEPWSQNRPRGEGAMFYTGGKSHDEFSKEMDKLQAMLDAGKIKWTEYVSRSEALRAARAENKEIDRAYRPGYTYRDGNTDANPEGIKQVLAPKQPPPTRELSKDRRGNDYRTKVAKKGFGSREAVVRAKAAYEQAERSYKDYERSKYRLRGATSGPAVWQHMNRLIRIFNLLASVKAGLYDPLYASKPERYSNMILNYLKQGETDGPVALHLGFDLSEVEDFVRGMKNYLGHLIEYYNPEFTLTLEGDF